MPIDELIDRERLEAKTQRVLRQLPESYGLALLWRYWENRSVRDMADGDRQDREGDRATARACPRAIQRTVGSGVAMDDERWLEQLAEAADVDDGGARARPSAAEGEGSIRRSSTINRRQDRFSAWPRRKPPGVDCACSNRPSRRCRSANGLER